MKRAWSCNDRKKAQRGGEEGIGDLLMLGQLIVGTVIKTRRQDRT